MQEVAPPFKELKQKNKRAHESFDEKNIKRMENKQADHIELLKNTRKKEQIIAAVVLVGLLGLIIASMANNNLHLKEIIISSLIVGGIALVKVFGQTHINEA